MLRSPAEFYLKYLIVHPDKLSNADIEATCEEFGLDHINTTYLDRLRSRCIPPEVFRPRDTSHRISQGFLLRERLHWLFQPSADTRVANEILGNPRAKEFVESMVLNEAPDVAIAHSLARNRGIVASIRALVQYKHFYWNMELLDNNQMRMLLQYRIEMAGQTGDGADRAGRAEHAAAKKASYLDSRKLASELPHSPTTALLTQMRMGLMPSKIDLRRTLEIGQAAAAIRTVEAVLVGSPTAALQALNYSQTARHITELLETVVKPDEDLREKLAQVVLTTDQQPIPSIHQLSAGKHTVDMVPDQVKNDSIESAAVARGAGTSAPSAVDDNDEPPIP